MRKSSTPTLLSFLLLFFSLGAVFAQPQTQGELLSQALAGVHSPTPKNLFIPVKKESAEISNQVSEYQTMVLAPSVLSGIVKQEPNLLGLNLPTTDGQVTLVLRKVEIFSPNFRLVTASNGDAITVNTGVHYRGVVAGSEGSTVSLSIFPDEVSGLIATKNVEYNLGKSSVLGAHMLYPSDKLMIQNDAVCGTKEVGVDMSVLDKQLPNYKSGESKCVQVYLETDYDVFQKRGTVQSVTQFISGMFNQVATLYENEEVVTTLSEVFIWDTESPYSATSSNGYLEDFRKYRTTFNGDVAHLVNMTGNLGGVAYVDVLCNTKYRYAFSSMYNNFQEVPTYSWSVNVFSHEMGHNLGSPHTHSCSWPGGPIDNCYTPEGLCGSGPNPENGGTIMSYCHLTNEGVNFNNGFGLLPGDLIRAKVAEANCLSVCDVDGCVAPRNLSASNITSNSVMLNWSSSVTATFYRVEIQQSGKDWQLVTTTNDLSLEVDGLDEVTTYQFRVRSHCGEGDASEYGDVLSATTLSDRVPCNAQGVSTTDEWISSVEIADTKIESGADDGYVKHSVQLITLDAGVDYPIALEPGFRLTLGIFENPQPEYWMVWIDLNGDGDYVDDGELLFDSQGTSSDVVRGNVNIPDVGLSGNKTIRVAMRRNAAANPCESFDRGEVEDIPVYINSSGVSVAETKLLESVTVYPNPTSSGEAFVKIGAHASSVKVIVSDMSGKQVFQSDLEPSQATQAHRMDCHNWQAGVYVITLFQEEERKHMRLVVQ